MSRNFSIQNTVLTNDHLYLISKMIWIEFMLNFAFIGKQQTNPYQNNVFPLLWILLSQLSQLVLLPNSFWLFKTIHQNLMLTFVEIHTPLQKRVLARPSPSSVLWGGTALSDPVLAHIIKPASGLDCFLLLYYHCVSFTMYVVLVHFKCDSKNVVSSMNKA